MVAREGLLGELVMGPYETGWHGRPVQLVQLLKPGTREELLASMIEARVIGIRRSLLISGLEQVTSGRKTVERYRQTWLCAHERISPLEWAAGPPPSGPRSSTGFDREDDDVAF